MAAVATAEGRAINKLEQRSNQHQNDPSNRCQSHLNTTAQYFSVTDTQIKNAVNLVGISYVKVKKKRLISYRCQ